MRTSAPLGAWRSVTSLPFKEIIINTKIHYRDKKNLTQFSWLRSPVREDVNTERWGSGGANDSEISAL